jgi:hypothetical protein
VAHVAGEKENEMSTRNSILHALGRCCAVLAVVAFAAVMAPRPAFGYTNTWCSASITCTGGSPQVTVGSGSFYSHPEVVPIFWESTVSPNYWTSPTAATRGQIIGTIQHILNGPYTAALQQYSHGLGLGPVRMTPVAPIDSTAIGNNFTFQTFQTEVNKLIGQGVVPPPLAHTEVIYAFFLPPGTSSTQLPNAGGFNSSGACDSTCGGNLAGLTYRYLAAFPPQTNANSNNYSFTFSHELAEALSQNVSVSGCTYNGSGGVHANQISDLCYCYGENQLGGAATVQPYWSVADNECVIPEGWQSVLQWAGTFWSILGGPARQVYAGEFGLIRTDVDDMLWKYGGGQQWTEIGYPGAMFSVGTSGIMGLTPDTSAVFRYDGSSWAPVGLSASALYSGGFDIATDYNGVSYIYNGSAYNWSQFTNAVDQIVVGDIWAYALDFARVAWVYAGGWTPSHYQSLELFAGGHASAASLDLTSAYSISAMGYTTVGGNPVPTNWLSMNSNGPGNMLALYGSSQAPLVELTPNGYYVEAETSAIGGPPPSWSILDHNGGWIGRLVGGGANLYALGPYFY